MTRTTPRTTRTLLALLAGLLALAAAAPLAAGTYSDAAIKEMKKYLVGDDRQREVPPAVDRPQFIPVTDASLYLDAKAVVFVEEPAGPDGQASIYPRNILVRHEVLNLEGPDGARRSVTYSPLTGSVIGFHGAVGRHNTTFGTTGEYLNMNRLLYDRATNGVWPQIPGECISGFLKGEVLTRFPLLWTTWGAARERYPDARVLSRDTGMRVNYNRDPYGSYRREGTWYTEFDPYPPLMNKDDRKGPKERVLGYARGGSAVAFVEAAVKRHGVATAEPGLDTLVALYDPDMDAVRVYHAEAEGRGLHFENVGGVIFDRETRSRWTPMGRAYEGRLKGMVLERAAAMDCMWFAWAAFYPGTLLWDGPGTGSSLF